jgi:hypothetical protein
MGTTSWNIAASDAAPADQRQQQEEPSVQPPPSMISDSGSDPTLDVHGLQHELSAAADTFHLDHLDDDLEDQFPTYAPDYVQSPQFCLQ